MDSQFLAAMVALLVVLACRSDDPTDSISCAEYAAKISDENTPYADAFAACRAEIERGQIVCHLRHCVHPLTEGKK